MMQKAIGEFIAALRKAKGMTQQNLAEELHVSNKTVSKWERGAGMPEITTLVALAEVFNVSVDDLINGKIQDKPPIYKGQKQIDYLINKKIKHFNVLILFSRLGMIVGFILMLTIGYATFRSIWAVGTALTIYVIFLGLSSYANMTITSSNEEFDLSQNQQLKYLKIKKTFYTLILFSSLTILSLPIIINAQAYTILEKESYFNLLPYLFLVIVIINIISHFIYRYILAKKNYQKGYRGKHYFYGVLIIISFITPLILNHLFPRYIVSDTKETLTYHSDDQEFHEIITWDDFYQNYYSSNQYDIVKIKKQDYYAYGNNLFLSVDKGKKYLPLYDNFTSIFRSSTTYKITYHPLTKAPMSLGFYSFVMLIEYIVIVAIIGLRYIVKQKTFH